MKRFAIIAMLVALSGCACDKAEHAQACRTAQKILVTSIFISASAALYESCRHDHGARSYQQHDVHIPTPPNCSTGACQ